MNNIRSLTFLLSFFIFTPSYLFAQETSTPRYNYLESFNQVAPAPSTDPWGNWNLVIVTLDKNEKPSDKTEIAINKPVKIKKDNGPEIVIQNFDLENGTGKLLRIECNDISITQKFDNNSQLKGWATQISCFKQKYYFIINPSQK